MPPAEGGIKRLSNACNCLYATYLLEVLAYGLYVLDVVHVNPEGAFENTVVALYVYLLYIGVELL